MKWINIDNLRARYPHKEKWIRLLEKLMKKKENLEKELKEMIKELDIE